MNHRRLLGAVMGLALMAGTLAGCSSGGYSVLATFDDIGDLQPRGSVQVADVRVGDVSSVKLTDDFKGEVKLRINNGVKIPKKVSAVLRTTSLLGEKFVELRAKGDPARGPFLDDGDRVSETFEAPELEFVAQEAVTVLGAVSANDVATLVDTGAEAFGGRRDDLRGLIDDLASISSTLAGRSQQITNIIDGLDRASATLAGGAPEVDTLLVNLAETTKILADNRQRAVNALGQLTRLAGVQNEVLGRYRNDIDRQIKQVDAIVGIAASQTAELGLLVDWLDRFVVGIPKVIPGDFTEVFMWLVPAQQDPRVGT